MRADSAEVIPNCVWHAIGIDLSKVCHSNNHTHPKELLAMFGVMMLEPFN